MPENNDLWIRIARTGTFKDSEGRQQSFGASDLDTIASTYDPAQLEAPLVFGHPKDSDPAYGWVKRLERRGEILFAQMAQVPSAVRELVENGRYRYVSMSLTPDKKRLRHVGLLGAVPPAIEGLGPVAFAGEPGISIDFTQETQGGNMPTPEEMQQQIGALQQQVEDLKAEVTKLKTERDESAKGKEDAQKKVEETTAEFSAYKKGIEVKEREKRVDALIAAGKLEPAKREETLSFAAALAEVSTPVSFSSSTGKVEQVSAQEKFLRDLESREKDPRFVDFSSAAPLPGHAAAPNMTINPAELTAKM